MRDLDDKVVAITGAGSGIGRALAHAFAAEGARLALSDIDEAAVTATAAALPGAVAHRVDVGDRDAIAAWAADINERFGRINLIVNNAGVALSGTVAALTLADYEHVMRVNFWGVVHGTQLFLPHLEASGEGHIVNISSVFGLTAQPFLSAYNASKFAVRGFTESLRQELDLARSCVSATCVHPGGIRTAIVRSARMDESVARATGRSTDETAREFERLFINTPEAAARAIVRGVRQDRRRVLIGPDARVFDLCQRLMPAAYQRLTTGIVRWRSRR
ncbi:MAG: SDR family oxidoreductase [bacterium]|nr:SDR family oxidoreductase [Myxococcales bacterium]MCB9553267.1 SDR family oxidoreductase [Myxococcales bacterium]